MKKTVVSLLSAFMVCSTAVSGVQAALVEVLPVSYVFDKGTDTGTYNYADWGGVQLTDGFYGVADWSVDLGNGPAYEWVGWVNDSPVNIDFDFGSPVQINQVNVGTTQDNLTDVVLPSVNLYSSNDGSSWSAFSSLVVPESTLNDNQHFVYQFDGFSVNNRYLRVSLVHSTDGPWTFTDEIDFYRDTMPAPEPSAMLLFGAGLSGMALSGFRKREEA